MCWVHSSCILHTFRSLRLRVTFFFPHVTMTYIMYIHRWSLASWNCSMACSDDWRVHLVLTGCSFGCARALFPTVLFHNIQCAQPIVFMVIDASTSFHMPTIFQTGLRFCKILRYCRFCGFGDRNRCGMLYNQKKHRICAISHHLLVLWQGFCLHNTRFNGARHVQHDVRLLRLWCRVFGDMCVS